MSRSEGFGEVEALVVSSETREGIGARVFLALFFNGIATIITVVAYFGPQPHDATFVGMLIGWHAFALAGSVLLMTLLSWGTWIIDLDGVTFEPCHGARRRLEWSEVERVCWFGTYAKFRGGGKVMTLNWHCLPDAQARRARERVAKILSGDFDLGVPWSLPEPARPWRRVVRRWSVLIAVGLALAIPWGAVALCLASRSVLAAAWLFAPLAAVAGYATLKGLMWEREMRRVHPAWPWRRRVRRSKTMDADW